MWVLWVLAGLSAVTTEELPPSCSKPVFCDSNLLHHVQLARLYPDSKTFVDMQLIQDDQKTLQEFDQLLDETDGNPSREQIKAFVDGHFANTTEIVDWTPEDFQEEPKFLLSIRDEKLRQFGKDIVSIWPTLGRKVRPEVFENENLYSLIPVSKGFIIPGGRFKEIYYWDTYWIIEGLLISGMKETAKGMIENLIELLKKIGHIPNGSRWYYQERSQPPLLAAMVSLYIRETKDIDFLRANIKALEDELEYWINSQIVTFEVNDKAHTQLRYYAPSTGPRPESYYEDYSAAQYFTSEDRQKEFYYDLKSAAESGWDFSTRWFIGPDGRNTGNLTTIRTKDIIPVDLNAIFANALQNVAYFQAILKNRRRAAHWAYLAKQWRSTIEQVFWNEDEGVWFDYDMLNGVHRKIFYPSNIAPLWMGAVDKKLVKKHSRRVLNYLKKSQGLDFPGGVPASLIRSGEQWDFPNAWPPLISMVVNALEALGNEEAKQLAFEVAQTWVRACHKGFSTNQQMFEKYDAEEPGKFGGGGEYVVQNGFGWSNGVVLELLAKYGRALTSADSIKSEGTATKENNHSSESNSNENHLRVLSIMKNK